MHSETAAAPAAPTLRTFRAPDAASALSAVKKALGPDAIIVSTRDVPGGLLRAPQIEITAAAPESAPDLVPAPAAAPAPSPIPPGLEPRALTYRQIPAPPVAFSSELVSLRSAMDDLRMELRQVARAAHGRAPTSSPAQGEVVSALEERGVAPRLAAALVAEVAGEADDAPGALMSAVYRRVAQQMIPARAPWRPARRHQFVALVGPTGAGKTTTLAKIAARAVLDSRLKVGLITVDTYRIGASNQIARYGQIMNAPTYVARDRGELLVAMDRCASLDLVLVDTAGRATSEVVARQAELIRSIPGMELQLVLSAATGARELQASAERYRAVAPDKLVLTKLDEAAAPGSVLSALEALPLPVSCVADGQRVPEDLHELTGTELVHRLLDPPGAGHASGAES